jgi:homopolymeric O-antigen transport system permease protein
MAALLTEGMVSQTLAADVREMVREQLDYRDLLFQITRRDLSLRYTQTIMGFGWAIFMPLVNTIIFSVVFTRVATLDVGMPYPLFAYCGLLMWNLFASAVRFSLTSLSSNTNLVAKVYFPREIFPFSAVTVSFVDFLVGSLVLVGMMIYYRIALTPAILFLPIVLAVCVLFTTAVGLILAMANLFYRDVKYIFEVIITIWMFATSVLYPVDKITGVAGVLIRLNPMTPIVDAFRQVLLFGRLPALAPFALTAAFSVVLFGLAWILFHRAEFRFAESV